MPVKLCMRIKLSVEWFLMNNRTYLIFNMKLNSTVLSQHLLVVNNIFFLKMFSLAIMDCMFKNVLQNKIDSKY